MKYDKFNKFNNKEAITLDSISHMTLCLDEDLIRSM